MEISFPKTKFGKMPGLADVRPISIAPVLYRICGRIRLQQLRTLLTHTLAPYLRATVQRRIAPHPGPGSGSSHRAVRDANKNNSRQKKSWDPAVIPFKPLGFGIFGGHGSLNPCQETTNGPPDMLDKSGFFHCYTH